VPDPKTREQVRVVNESDRHEYHSVLSPKAEKSVDVNTAMRKVAAIRTEVCDRFLERDAEVNILLLSLLTRQHCLLLGARGEGKSAVVDAVLKRIPDARYYKAQVWKTTSADEILGLPNPVAFRNAGTFERMISNMLPEADVAFIDEIFKSNSTLLTSFLRLMNEREFVQAGKTVSAPLASMVGASNEMPQSDDLGAFWDRFLYRTWIAPLSTAGRQQFVSDEMTRRGKRITGADVSGQTGTTLTLAELEALQVETLRVLIPESVHATYFKIEQELDMRGYARPSVRRLGWLWDAVAASALLDGRTVAIEDDLLPLKWCLWEDRNQIKEIGTIVTLAAAPTLAEAQRIYDGIIAEIEETLVVGRKVQVASGDTATDKKAAFDFTVRVQETNPKVQRAIRDLDAKVNEAKGAGRSTLQVERMRDDVTAKGKEVFKLMMGPSF
jgi:MoxR-like ATPase